MTTPTTSIYLVLISFSLLLGSCGCPPDVKLGEVRLIKPDFLQFSGAESLTYTNATTSETSIFNGIDPGYNTSKLIVASLCSKPPISNQISYYESIPFATKIYRGKGVDYQLSYFYKTFDPVQGDTTSYVDALNIAGSRFSLNILVSDRGKPALKSTPLVKQQDQARVIADTIINGKRYQQVYCHKDTPPSVFFTRDRGVVAFLRDGTWWHQTGFHP
ncbi:MAG: hypothetical protein EOO39_01620 [Cytophagaceae bacterium]|nr:MAG: hypothetical protein EOO39_01620 [Cytophagaceae bacterium]